MDAKYAQSVAQLNILILLNSATKQGLLRDDAYAKYANCAKYSFVCRQCVLVGQWPSSALVLAARELYDIGGGLHVVPVNAPHLFDLKHETWKIT